MGRAEKRKEARRQQKANQEYNQYKAMLLSKEHRELLDYAKQGVAPEVVNKIYEKARKEYEEKMNEIIKRESRRIRLTSLDNCIRAIAIALNQGYGFGKKRIKKVMCDGVNVIMDCVIDDDKINREFEKLGLFVDLEDAIEPVKEIDKSEEEK